MRNRSTPLSCGSRLKAIRRAAEWKQLWLADEAGVSAAAIAQYELGYRIPSQESFEKIVTCFKRYLGSTAELTELQVAYDRDRARRGRKH
jgi:transcriptional regulator with XRE-family HTH domain